MKKLICILSIFAVALCLSKISLAAEHPGEHPGTPAKSEHPGSPAKAEHEEHPGKTDEHPDEKAMLSARDIINGIKEHINEVTKANAGYFLLSDLTEGKDLWLNLIKVHEDRVSYIKKDDAYFACTDFITDDGKTTYDIDFWMKKSDTGELEVYQTKIHKKDGTPRFIYRDDEIVPVETLQMAPEEHT